MAMNTVPHFVDSTTGKLVQVKSTGEAVNVSLTSSSDGVFPQDITRTKNIIGTGGNETTIAASGDAVGVADMRDVSFPRSLVLVSSSGSGTVKIDAIPQIDLLGTYAGASIEIDTGITASTVIDLPETLLPYCHFCKFTVTETGGANSLDVYLALMGKGGA